MKNKILVINGASRINGNTDIVIHKIIEGAHDAGINIKLVELRKKKIAECIGCYYCYNNEHCSIQDDMQEIHDDIKDADLIIFASPLYWWGVTGLMKTFIDRLYLYYPSRNGEFISNKKAVIITTMAVSDVEDEAKILVQFYNLLFKRLNIKIVDMIFFSGIFKKRAVLDQGEYLNQAYLLGKNL